MEAQQINSNPPASQGVGSSLLNNSKKRPLSEITTHMFPNDLHSKDDFYDYFDKHCKCPLILT